MIKPSVIRNNINSSIYTNPYWTSEAYKGLFLAWHTRTAKEGNPCLQEDFLWRTVYMSIIYQLSYFYFNRSMSSWFITAINTSFLLTVKQTNYLDNHYILPTKIKIYVCQWLKGNVTSPRTRNHSLTKLNSQIYLSKNSFRIQAFGYSKIEDLNVEINNYWPSHALISFV